MRILLTVHQFLPEYSAGTEILTFDTAKELQRLGHEVFVFTGFPTKAKINDADRFDRYSYEGIQVERFHHARVPTGGGANIVEAEYNNQFFANYFRKYLKNLKPDIVHFFHLARLSASAIDVCVELGIPKVFTATDFWLICPRNQLRLPDNSPCSGPDRSGVNCLRHMVALTQPRIVQAAVKRAPDRLVALIIWLVNKGVFGGGSHAKHVRALSARPGHLRSRMNMLDRVLVATRFMQEVLTRHGLDPRKAILIRFGVNFQSTNGSSIRGDKPALRIGFIGTLYEHKGAHVLIEAVKQLPPDVPVDLKIYGDLVAYPKYTERLKRLVDGDQRISFCGKFDRTQIGDVLSSMDVLVVPSIWYENTPLVIYFAQAAGCPVVVSNVDGMTEVVKHGVNGLVFQTGNAAGLGEAITTLAKDREFLRNLAQNAKKPKSSSEYAAELVTISETVLVKGQTV